MLRGPCPRPRRPGPPQLLLAVTACLFVAVAGATADVVYMKDGYTLHGKVQVDYDVITDPVTGQVVPVRSGSNFFIVFDRVRYVIFNHRYVQDADPDKNIRKDFVEFRYPLPRNQYGTLPKAAFVERITPFDDHWQRTVFLKSDLGRSKLQQRLTSLTPYAAHVEGTAYRWDMRYLTHELGLDLVKQLLATESSLKETNGPDIDKRLKRFRFLMQGGWLLAAGEELDRAAKDLPAEKQRLDRARQELFQAKVASMWEETELAHKAGCYSRVRDILRRIPTTELDPRIAGEVASLRSKYETWDRQVGEVKKLLGAITGRLVGPPRPVFADALWAIRSEVGPDTIDRLEPFLTLAPQHEKELNSKQPPTNTDDEILSLAVTGWVLGREAAEPKVATAERYWDSREFVRAYLKTHEPAERRRLLETYQKQSPLSVDEMAQLIALMSPPEAADPAAASNGVESRETQIPWGLNRKVSYLLKLPPEYRPGRSYPLLIILHANGETPGEALNRWAFEAERNGYILAAPQWGTSLPGYNYTEQEHQAVLDLIKDMRRRYAVDSDRVFLNGYGDGGTMAFDVGMSHPDLFAGIVPMNARPLWTASTWYWRNAQYLPFYIVTGELAGDTTSKNRRVFESWMQKGYPSLMTIYKGRPMEFYAAELPFIFDWMGRKKRATGFPELGRNPNAGFQSEEFVTMRAGDNHFYWLEAESILEKYLNPSMGRKDGSPAAMQAQIRDGNHIVINTRGVKQLRVWLGRVWDAQAGARAMIDFEKPVRITINRAGGKERTIVPSLATMLEDLYVRGDRQRLFMASVELTGLQ